MRHMKLTGFKIVQITPFFKPHLGGVETHVEKITQLLVAQKNQVTILTIQHSPDLKLVEKFAGAEVYRLPFIAINQKMATWRWMWSQRKQLQAADIIQIHDLVWWLYPFYFFYRQKMAITFHGWEGEFPVPLKNKIQRFLASKLVTATIHIGAWIQEFYWDKPDSVIYGGAETTHLENSYQIQKNSINCAYIGRLEAVNEIERYVMLIKNLKKNLTVKMTWVGDGSYRVACQKIGKVTGMIDQPSNYLQTADYVFANSYLSILEAQSMGKVVVALYSHKLKQRYLESYPGSEYLIMATDPLDAQVKIEELIIDRQKFSVLSSNGQKFARTQTWEKVLHSYEEIWNTFIR